MGSEDIDDIRRVLAICFRDGKALDSIDVERILSLDMEWLSPDDAETAVQSLIATGWLKEEENALTPSIAITGITAPLGWFPRPTRLINPVPVQLDGEVNKIEITETAPIIATPIEKPTASEINSADPRVKLAKRLTKYIAKTSKIDIAEVERRANRKQKSLAVATNWMCLALVAKEQGIQMQEIVNALAVR